MPGFDGTGPSGRGPMTGRGMGYCAIPLGAGNQPESAVAPLLSVASMRPAYRFFFGRGLRLGRGRGRGCRRGHSRGRWRW